MPAAAQRIITFHHHRVIGIKQVAFTEIAVERDHRLTVLAFDGRPGDHEGFVLHLDAAAFRRGDKPVFAVIKACRDRGKEFDQPRPFDPAALMVPLPKRSMRIPKSCATMPFAPGFRPTRRVLPVFSVYDPVRTWRQSSLSSREDAQ